MPPVVPPLPPSDPPGAELPAALISAPPDPALAMTSEPVCPPGLPCIAGLEGGWLPPMPPMPPEPTGAAPAPAPAVVEGDVNPVSLSCPSEQPATTALIQASAQTPSRHPRV